MCFLHLIHQSSKAWERQTVVILKTHFSMEATLIIDNKEQLQTNKKSCKQDTNAWPSNKHKRTVGRSPIIQCVLFPSAAEWGSFYVLFARFDFKNIQEIIRPEFPMFNLTILLMLAIVSDKNIWWILNTLIYKIAAFLCVSFIFERTINIWIACFEWSFS